MASEQTLEAASGLPGSDGDAADAYKASMLSIMRQALLDLPEEATLGEIVEAARANPQMEPVLGLMSIQQLIDIAVERPFNPSSTDDGEFDAEDSSADISVSASIIRRRSEVPDGDLTVLRLLADRGPQSEAQICRAGKLSAEQLRLILRGMRTKGFVHSEGSGNKRKLKITRTGSTHLRKLGGDPPPTRSGGGRRRRRRA